MPRTVIGGSGNGGGGEAIGLPIAISDVVDLQTTLDAIDGLIDGKSPLSVSAGISADTTNTSTSTYVTLFDFSLTGGKWYILEGKVAWSQANGNGINLQALITSGSDISSDSGYMVRLYNNNALVEHKILKNHTTSSLFSYSNAVTTTGIAMIEFSARIKVTADRTLRLQYRKSTAATGHAVTIYKDGTWFKLSEVS